MLTPIHTSSKWAFPPEDLASCPLLSSGIKMYLRKELLRNPTPCGFEINLVETRELSTTVNVKTVDSNKVSLMGQ